MDLSQLTPDIGPYVVEVRVARTSPIRKQPLNHRFQSISLQDAKGHVMRALIFNDDIEFQTHLDECVLHFNMNTTIQMMMGCPVPEIPVCTDLHDIIPARRMGCRYNLLSIVLYVGPVYFVQPRCADSIAVREVIVIIVTDASAAATMELIAFNRFACDDGGVLSNIVPPFRVVGLTALKLNHRKGLGLSATPCSRLLDTPAGDRADGLRERMHLNGSILVSRQTQSRRAIYNETKGKCITIAGLLGKRVYNVGCWIWR